MTRSANLGRRRMDRPNHHLACFVIVRGPSLGERFSLSKERMVIGRKSDVEIWIDDRSISREHAEVIVKGKELILRDLGGAAGTYCNDKKIDEKVLAEGDLIRIGEVFLKYLAPNSIEHLYLYEISEQARKDALTGVFNKNVFQTYLERSLIRCTELQEPLSLLMLDLDYFKKINDTWGHLAGDGVLKEFADRVKDRIRPTDLLARFGGEEFSLILPHTNLKEGGIVAERIRSRIASRPFRFEGHLLPLTVSIGLTERSASSELSASLLARADKALYQAKQEGRNRICSG